MIAPRARPAPFPLLVLAAIAVGAAAFHPPIAAGQTIGAVPTPTPPGRESAWVLEHVEFPERIALGTMAVKIWARVGAADDGEHPAGVTLVLPGSDDGRRIPMRPLDGAFDSAVEDVVATIDTYTWVKDAAHEYEIRVRGATTAPVALTRGTIRVKPRLETADLFLFDTTGAAHAWIGTGAGGYAPAGTLEAPVEGGRPHLVDVDGDRRPDLIVPGPDGEVKIFHNRGAGRFALQRTLGLGLAAVDTAVGDVDGDGRPDLVSVSRDLGLEIRLGLADAVSFTAVLDRVPEAVELADLDGDGADEIWVGLLGMHSTDVERWVRSSSPSTEDPVWKATGTLPPPTGARGRIRRICRFSPNPTAADGAERLLVLWGSGDEGTLESWEGPADIQAGSEPALIGVVRLPGEPLDVVTGRLGPNGAPVWRAMIRNPHDREIRLHSPEGPIEPRWAASGDVSRVAACDLDDDGDDDLLVAGEELRLWMNVRGAWREAGESPYRLESPLTALLPGRLDEKTP